MNTDMIVAELKAEVKKLEQVIAVLENDGAKSGSRRSKSGNSGSDE